MLQDIYYIRPHYQDTESKQLYLIQRNKHREAAKIRRQRNITQMKRDQNSSKRTEQNGNKQFIRCMNVSEFKTMIIRMLRELSEDLDSIKKIKSDTTDTLIEIKNNL